MPKPKPKWKTLALALDADVYEVLAVMAAAQGETIEETAASILAEVVRDSMESVE